MRCVYINLAGARDRRAWMESHLARVAPPGVSLARFEAVEAAAAAALPGAIRPAEKACFRSHREAIATCHDGESPLLVLEDDVVLSARAFTADRLPPGEDWDLLFTDATLADPGLWIGLAKGRPALIAQDRVRIIDLAHARFASAAAYVVNGRSKARVLEALDAFERLDLPYDIALRQLVHAGRLRACLTFPFLTSVAALSGASQIQPGGNAADLISDAFRRLMFVDRDLAASRAEAEAIAAGCDEESRLVGMILGGVVSGQFQPK
ncbi:MAG: hypothetical protein ACOY9C_08485 [Pseudomonadota bacterium]